MSSRTILTTKLQELFDDNTDRNIKRLQVFELVLKLDTDELDTILEVMKKQTPTPTPQTKKMVQTTLTRDKRYNSDDDKIIEYFKSKKSPYDVVIKQYKVSESSLRRHAGGKYSDAGRQALKSFYEDGQTKKIEELPIIKTVVPETNSTPQQTTNEKINFKHIKTITKDSNGDLIYNEALRTKPTNAETIENILNINTFKKSIFYQRVLDIMEDNKNLKFSETPKTGHSVYCALVKIPKNGSDEIHAYIGEANNRPVRDRWIEHANEISKNNTDKYKAMKIAGPENILVFYISDTRTEDECARYICGEKYVDNPLCLNMKLCAKTYKKI